MDVLAQDVVNVQTEGFVFRLSNRHEICQPQLPVKFQSDIKF